jgi:hypothetical protein
VTDAGNDEDFMARTPEKQTLPGAQAARTPTKESVPDVLASYNTLSKH